MARRIGTGNGGRLLVVVGVIGMGAGVSHGQGGGVFPPFPPVVEERAPGERDALFADLGVREAIQRGTDEGKVTVVVSRLLRPRAGREAWWGNASFRRWLADEAVVVWASANQLDLLTQVYRGDRGRVCSFGGMDLFVDGLHAAMAGGAFDERDLGGAETQSISVADRAALIDATAPGVTAEWLMAVIDRQRALGEIRSGVLAHRAEKRRALGSGVGVSPRPRVFAMKTEGAGGAMVPAVSDVAPGAGEGWRGVLERWREAARLEQLEPAKAAAELTWLIERATEIEPGAGLLATSAAERLLAIAERTQMARARVEAIVDSTGGVLSLTGQGEGIDGLALVMLVRGAGQAPAMVDATLSRDEREMLRRSHGRAVLEQVDELRRSGRGEWKRVVSALERGLEAERPAFVSAGRWEGLSALRRGLIARVVAEGVWESSQQARGDGAALEAAEKLEVISRVWAPAERRAALRGIALALVLAERSSPVLRDKVATWLEGDAEAASLREAVRELGR
jgi:hypothetical protein